MSLTFIDEDGGDLPEAGPQPTASKLLSDYNALDSAGKAAFRAAIAGTHNIVAGTGAIVALTGAQSGDTAGVAASQTAVYRFNGDSPTIESSWVNLVTGATLGDATELTFIDEDGGDFPGSTAAGLLVDAWVNLSHAQQKEFRDAIKPQYATVADQAARLALTNQVPGDYARQVGTGLFRLRVLPSSANGNWDLILTLAV